jgi:hypothetical protein
LPYGAPCLGFNGEYSSLVESIWRMQNVAFTGLLPLMTTPAEELLEQTLGGGAFQNTPLAGMLGSDAMLNFATFNLTDFYFSWRGEDSAGSPFLEPLVNPAWANDMDLGIWHTTPFLFPAGTYATSYGLRYECYLGLECDLSTRAMP